MGWRMVVSDGEKKESRTWGGDAWGYVVTI